MSPSSLRAVVCGNVNVEVGFGAPALPLPTVDSADFPGALTLGVSGVECTGLRRSLIWEPR